MKLILTILVICLSFSAFGVGRDTTKNNDTILLPQDKIQNVEITCNAPSNQPKTEVINSQYEFNKFIGNSCHPTPAVDFATQTLLYFPTKIMGYKPDYVRTIQISKKQVVYKVNIISHKGATMLLFNNNCIAIPKIDSGSAVHFLKTEATGDDGK